MYCDLKVQGWSLRCKLTLKSVESVESCLKFVCGMVKQFFFVDSRTNQSGLVFTFCVLEKLKWTKPEPWSCWLFIACGHGLACINGQPGRSSPAGFVSPWRDMSSDSLHLCLSLWFIYAPFWLHTYTYTLSFPLWLRSSPPYFRESSTGQTGLKRFCSLLMMLISVCVTSHFSPLKDTLDELQTQMN